MYNITLYKVTHVHIVAFWYVHPFNTSGSAWVLHHFTTFQPHKYTVSIVLYPWYNEIKAYFSDIDS